jgi:hypothetical protein
MDKAIHCYLALNQESFAVNIGVSAMVVKQRPSQKPRLPSPVLWAIVHKISDAHWHLLEARSRATGKNPQYFRLLALLRSMELYDPAFEAQEFPKRELHPLRTNARKWLIAASIKLGLYANEVQGPVTEIDVLLQWECVDDALMMFEKAKEQAIAQGDHARLVRHCEQEIAIVKQMEMGEKRITRLAELSAEAIEGAKKMNSIEAEVRNQTVRYIEVNKYRFELHGEFDLQDCETYFKSRFHNQDISSWPILLQIDKLHIDEWTQYVIGDFPKSIAIAQQILARYNSNEEIRLIRPSDHAKILFRLCVNHSQLGNMEQSKKLLAAFRAVEPTALGTREYYLGFYLHALFKIGYDTRDLSLPAEGASIWEAHKTFLLSQAMDSTATISLLFVCSYHVAIGDISKARSVFSLLFKVEQAIQPVWAQALYRVLYIIILLEEGDETGLQSYGKRYKGHLKKLEAATLGLSIISKLAQPKNVYKPKSLSISLGKVLRLIQQHESTGENTYRPFLFPLMHWAERKLAKLKGVDYYHVMPPIADPEGE